MNNNKKRGDFAEIAYDYGSGDKKTEKCRS